MLSAQNQFDYPLQHVTAIDISNGHTHTETHTETHTRHEQAVLYVFTRYVVKRDVYNKLLLGAYSISHTLQR